MCCYQWQQWTWIETQYFQVLMLFLQKSPNIFVVSAPFKWLPVQQDALFVMLNSKIHILLSGPYPSRPTNGVPG